MNFPVKSYGWPTLALGTLLLGGCLQEPVDGPNDDERLYDEAYALRLAGRCEEAEPLYAQVVEDWPQSLKVDDARVGLGRCRVELGDFEGAVEAYRTVPAGSSLRATALLEVGSAMQKDLWTWPLDSASAAFDRVRVAFPGTAEAYEALYQQAATWYAKVGERVSPVAAYYDSALVRYDQVLEVVTFRSRARESLYQGAWIHYQRNRWQLAADRFLDYRVSYPRDAQVDGALYYQARAATQLGQGCSARALLDTLLSEYPQSDRLSDAARERASLACP